jgi:hypothetical protein
MDKAKTKVKCKETGPVCKIKSKIQKIIKFHITVVKCVTTEEWTVNAANCHALQIYFAQTDIFNFFKIGLFTQSKLNLKVGV